MYKTLKISTIVILVILLISGLVALSFRNVVSVMAYPIGALFANYAVVLIVIISLKKQFCKLLVIAIIWILFLAPIVWLIVAPEQLPILMPVLDIDMK